MKLKLFIAMNGLAGQKLETKMLPNSKREVINLIVDGKNTTIMSKRNELIDLEGTLVPLRNGKDGPIVENTFVCTTKQGLAVHRTLVIE
jgi:hypothetical protein